jgi:serine protease DegQ
MKRAPLYSRSARARAPAEESAPATPVARPRWRTRLAARREALLWLLVAALVAAVGAQSLLTPRQRSLTQNDIDAAVRHTLEKQPLPSQVAKAYDVVRGSVVRVQGYSSDEEADDDDSSPPQAGAEPKKADPKAAKEERPESRKGAQIDRSTGTGVVIVDKGLILTNMHVVIGAKRIKVIFADGLESDASLINVQPEHDLAVLKAHRVPDDLIAATMRSTADLAPGDHVAAVGFPFGIGPSVSAGVVSGLRREFRSPEGQRALSNLIQFDAAANPGNSGGPLITMEGEVVGIVTAILNPSEQRTFIGIGFAVPIENAAAAAGLPPF